MNILVVTNMYPSDKDAVYGVFVKNFVDGITYRNSGGKCRVIAIRGKKYGVMAKIYAYMKFYASLSVNLLFKNYDLVYVHTVTFPIIPIRFVSIFRKLPLVFNVHGDDVLPATTLKKKLKNIAAKVLPEAKMIVAPSEYFKEVVLNEFSGVKPENVYVSPSGGIDERFFVDKKKDLLTPHTLILGFVSRIDEGKGWELFVNTIKSIVNSGIDCRGVIVGGGADTRKLQNLITNLELDDYIDYLGAVPQERLPEIYSSFDLLIFPTERKAESLGLVGLEAMAAGTPVIAGNVGGPAGYIVEGRNGYLFTPGNQKELVSKIHAYLSLDSSLKEAMSTYARSTASSYSSDIVNDQLYNKLIQLL